jgi:hypothetical protein
MSHQHPAKDFILKDKEKKYNERKVKDFHPQR